MSLTLSFWALNHNARIAAANANTRLEAANNAAQKLFTSGLSSTVAPSVLTNATSTSNFIINPLGLISLNASMNAALLAAQEGSDRVNQQAARLNTSTKRPGGNLSSQVTFHGSLGVKFGTAGPAMGGAYRFVSGTALQTAFKAAFGSKRSAGEAIDKVSVAGNTLTGSTSGPKAHDVFTLTLTPETGLYTFKLLAPIDQSTKKGSYNAIYLQGLMQATDAKGQKMALPTVEIDVYNDYGPVSSQGNWALLHEGSLTYNAPNGISSSTSASKASAVQAAKKAYKPPTDPRTLHGYTTSTSAGLGVINSVNIFS